MNKISQAAALLGSIRSPKKKNSSAKNGRLGGRPRAEFPENVKTDKIDTDLRQLASWHINSTGYCLGWVRMGNERIHARMHRLVLERKLGRKLLPTELVDHINGEKLDNRRYNLRLANAQQNAQNRRSCRSLSGIRGVRKNPSGRFDAYIKFRGKYFFVGYFQTAEEAEKAVLKERKRLGFFDGAFVPSPKS